MDEFCGSPLWQYNLTWNITTQPDLTPCFQETILLWVPALFLWFALPFEYLSISKSRGVFIPVTLLNLFKIFLVTVLCLLSVAELIETIVVGKTESTYLLEFSHAIIKSITYIIAFLLLVIHRKKGIHTSGVLFCFWLLMTVAALINVRSLIRSSMRDHAIETLPDWHFSELRFTLRIVATPIIITQFILACIADRKAQDPFVAIGDDILNRSPENDCSILSLATFSWLDSFVWLGYKRTLTQDDIYSLKTEYRVENICEKFDRDVSIAIEKGKEIRRQKLAQEQDQDHELIARGTTQRTSWMKLVRKGNQTPPNYHVVRENEGQDVNSLYVSTPKLIIGAFWPTLLLVLTLRVTTSFLTFASPLLLDRIIGFTKPDNNEPSWRGWLYTIGLFSLSVIEALIDNQEQRISNINVMKVKTCISSALYRKTLKLSQRGRKEFTTGQIVNLMSNDTQKVADFLQQFNSLFTAPIQLIISMTLLYQQLGIAVMAGIFVMILNVPLNIWVTGKLRTLQSINMKAKDKRIKLLTEIFNGIKIIKIHSWDDAFRERVENIREKEIDTLTSQTWYSAVITFSFTSLPFVIGLASFAAYILMDPNNVLDANRVFVSLALFNKIRIPIAVLPMVLTSLSVYIVAVKRLNKFFEADEIDPESRKQIDDGNHVIKIKDGKFKWDSKNDFALENVNVAIEKRKLVAIVGTVGSGKSTLLSAILGNVEKYNGEVQIDKQSTVAYVPQEAWILNATIKNNIKLNKVMNEDKYQRILEACALTQDLKTLPMGDESEIGEKGINLSGGQKQRVSIARAVYADNDIYLFDDPLSAVDAHVGRHIFDQIIGPRGMLSDRTRILVTNKLSVLPEVDQIIVLKDGQFVEMGSYEELLAGKSVFSQLLLNYLIENSIDGKTVELTEQGKIDLITKELKRLEEKQSQLENGNVSNDAVKKEATLQVTSNQDSQSGKKSPSGPNRNLTGQEVSQVGSVALETHLNFIRAMGINMVIALCIYIVSALFGLGTNVWLGEWSNDASNETLSHDSKQRNIRLGVYAALGFSETFCIICSTIILNLACLNGSKILHNRMIARIIRAPMSWFNVTPSGRIINRFSKDIDVVDTSIRFNVRLLMVIALRAITSMILICYGSIYSLIFIIPIVLLYFLFQIFYISTSRQLKRIESTTRSPIYNHFSETIDGTTSIRAFGAEREFLLEASHRINTNNGVFYISFTSARWLTVRLEFLGFIVVLVASLAATLSRGYIEPGTAGLSVTYALTITVVLSFLVRTYSDYENNVVSVERLLEYTKTPVEPDDDAAPSDPNWPSKGQIVFDHYSSRYRPELELVLKDFNLNIKPSEKVGLVGRTGAGKSSITLSLFRIFEAADGQILVDGVNIAQIELKILRSKLSIIPQEPFLFTGTIRQNLDPLGECPDDQIWRAVDLAHLSTFLRSLPNGLEHEVNEGGGNFSVGQKQLFCLARALLRKSKILILDEATAAVDLETDNLIQQTIRKEFKESTILTIAHRLETIQDYDRVVVMENGSLAEEGQPSELIKQKSTKFHSLAKEAGLTK